MISFRNTGSLKLASVLLIALMALAGCNNGGSSQSVVAPTGLSYPIPAPLIEGSAISPLTPTVATGTATSYSVAPTLPLGLALDPVTGQIRGIPTQVTPLTTYIVTATNILGSTTFALELVVQPQAPCGLTYTDIGATYLVGQAITPNTATLSCGPADLFAVTPSLPAGLALDAVTGEITGTPTVPAPLAVYTVTASNVTGSDSFDLTITVNPEAPCNLAFTDPAPVYTVGTAIAPNVGSSACGAPSDWSVSPALPAGLVLDAATGTITGTPTAELAATLFTFTGQNVTGSATVDMTIVVNRAAPLAIDYSEPTATYLAGLAITPNAPTVTGGIPDSWSVAPALPAGLLLDPATGEITGTPNAVTPTANYVVTASNVSGSVTTTLTLTVDPQAPCDVAYPLTNAVYQLGLPIVANLPSFNCGTPDLWTIAPALPAGLVLDAATGEISGTPTALSALTSYTVTASNVTGTDSVSITITVNPQAPCNLTYGNLNGTYLDGVTITPNVPSVACGPVAMYSITPALPAGLSIDTATGVISGTPAGASPTTSYTVVAANISGSDSVTFTITVIPQAPCTLTYSEPAAVYQLDLPITANVPTVGCGTPDNFSVTPALPAGLALSPTTGQIVGTPTALAAAASYTISASNLTGSTSTTITIEVVPQPPCNLSYTDLNPVYVDQAPIAANIASFDCGTPDSWSIAPALPAGLNFNTATGAITGTPTAITPATTFTVTATNVTGSATVDLTITVNPEAPCNLSYTDLTPTYLVGTPIAPNAPSFACGAPTSYTVTPALPSGLSLDPATGMITGTPSLRAGTGSYTVTGQNVTGSDSVVLTITVNPQAPCNLTYVDPAPVYIVGTPISTNTTVFGCGTPDSYTISPALPAGLNFDPLTGAIRGIPTSLQAATAHTVVATNVTGSDSTVITITVNPQAPCNLAYASPVATYTVNQGIATNFPSFACGAPDSYSVAPALPAGLLLDPVSGTISGTPLAEAVTTDYTVTAQNATGSDTATVTITVNPEAPCNLTYSGTNEIYLVGMPITPNTPSFACGTPTSYSVTPALPNGLLLDPVTGEITGTPLVVSLFTIYTITGSNVTGADTATISLTVNPQAPCNLTYSSPSSLYTVGTPIALNVPDVDCGAPSSYAIAPALPSGLSINPLTGVISGTPAVETPLLSYTVTAMNVSGSDTTTISIEVQPETPCNLHYTLENPTYLVGTPIASNAPTFGCGTPTSFSVVPALPAGLALDIFTGIITGTPVLPAPTANYVVTASNASGGTSVTLSITVNPLAPCTINYSTPVASYLDGMMITPNVPSFTCGEPDSWSIAPALPAGLALDAATGVISGTPAGVSALTTYLVTGSNVTGSDSVQISIEVLPQAPCNLTYSDLTADYLVGMPITANVPSHSCGQPDLYVVTPALPAGLALDAATGVISGTPSAVTAQATYTVTASNATGSDSVDLVLAVLPQAPCNVAYPTPTAVYLLGDTITANVPTFGCGTPDTWTIAPALPAGLLLDAATGTISGAPTALSPATNYSVTATNASGSDTATISITVNPQAPAGLTYADPAPTYLLGDPIAPNAPTSTGGAIDSYAVAPALPAGLSLDATTGVISGTPTALLAATAFTITGSNVTGSTDATVMITVDPQAPAGLVYDDNAPVYLVGDPITPNTPSSTGGAVDSYSVSPALPAGLLLDPVTGVISGTPTTVTAAALYVVTATNVTGSADANLTITVNPQGLGVLTYSDPSPTYLLGDLITPNVPTFTGGTPDSYTVAPALPAGLALDGTTGVITGTPTALQAATIHTITATNVTGSATAAVTITVDPQAPTGLTYTDLAPTYTVGTAIAANVATVTGTVDSFTVSPALPAGLLLDATTGEITGTPSLEAALATYTVTATNVTGSTSVDLAITVNPAAPAGLSYADPAPTYLLGLAIAPNAPTSTGGPIDSYTVAPALPAGLLLDATTGVISGTPTALQAATTHTVTATNVTGSTTADVTITVDPQAPAGLVYGDPAPTYLLGDPIAPNAPTSTGGAIDSFTVAPALPAGLLLDAVTGVISGTPTALVTASAHTITATNVTGSDTATVTITVNPQAPAGLTYTDLAPVYTDGVAIPANVATVTGTVDSFTVSPALPAGLLLDALTGEITGTPAGPAALATYTVTATNVTGSDSVDLAITVNAAAPAGLVYADANPTYLIGSPIAPNAPTSTGGAIDSYTVAPALPAGLLLDGTTGVISGTPTALVTASAHTITGSNASGSTDALVTITVNPQAPTAITYADPAPTYLLGDLIAPNLPTVTGGAADSFAVAPALPAGLLLDTLTGAITGTPTALVTASAHTVTATNATGSADTTITITVNPQAPTGLTYDDNAPTYVVGTAITANLATVTGTVDGFTVAPALPAGLALDTLTGAITGTPTTVTAAAAYTVTATNVTGSTDVTLLITVNPAAPAGLSYSDPAPSYLVGDAITPNVPSSTGGPIDNYSISPALQAGLTLDALTGVISGTPTLVEAATLYTITATNVTGTTTADVTITVNPQGVGVLTYSEPAPVYLLGLPITPNTPTFTGGTPDSFTVSPALPAGLALDATTGVISGTPTALQAATIHTITATNVTGSTNGSVTITVNPQAPAGLTYSDPAPTYVVGAAIAANLPTVGGGDVDTFSVAPALPAGLLLDATTGAITGTPTAEAALATYTVTAENVTGQTTFDLAITVNPAAPAGLSYNDAVPTYLLGLAIPANAPSSTGGPIDSYSIAPALPAGLALDTVTGVISGTPTALQAATTHTVTATNVSGSTTADLVITVDPQAPAGLAYGDPAPTYLLGDAIAPNVPTFTGGTPDNFTVAPALPAGLVLDAVTGVISGTPTALQAATTHTVTATNVTGSTTADVTITVDPQAPLGLTYDDANPTYTVGTAITANNATVGGGAVDSFTVAPALPAGLALDALTGQITGTPTVEAALAAYVVTASNVTGSATATLMITVNPAAPAGLTYDDAAPTYLEGLPITPNNPSSTGGPIASYAIAPALPAGLLLDTVTGVISGTPTALQTAIAHTITATNASGSTTAIVTITVDPQAPTALTYSEPNAVYLLGDPITPNVPTVSGGTASGYSIAPALPAGLLLDTATGVISGTPTALQAATIHTVTATNVTGSITGVVAITVNPQAPAGLTYSDPAPTYTVGTAIAANLATVGGGDVDTFSVAPALPAGLLLDATTGQITGTPTAEAALATYTVTAENVTGQATFDLAITVNPAAPAGLTYADPAPTYLLGLAIAPNAPTSTGGPIDSYSIAPALPAGLALDAVTGVISGTPTALQAATTHTVTATNVTGQTTADVTITVNPQAPAGLTYSDPAPTYLLGLAIAANTPSSTGGAIDSYSVAPALPAGLALDTVTGVISGTPTALQAATTHTVTATNVTGSTTADVTITVDPQAPAGLTYGDPTPTYLLDVLIAPNAPTSTGGAIDSYAIAPALPAGLALDTVTGVISGTPTALQAATTHTVTATNVTGSTTADVTITVNPQEPAGLVYSEPTAVYLLGDPITANTPTSTGGAIDSYAIAPALPAGLTLDTVTGVISGTPTALSRTTTHTVTATNVTGSTTADVTITVDPQAPAGLTYSDLAPTYTVGTAITANTPTVGGGAVDTYTVSPALPAGLLLDATTGVITGTPTSATTVATYTVTAENVTGSSTVDLTITVNPEAPATITYPTTTAVYTMNQPIAANTPTFTGGMPTDWTVAPALPAGLLLDPATGEITGTPTALSPATSYTVDASNVSGSASTTISIEVINPAPCDIVYPASSYSLSTGVALAPQTPTVGCGIPDSFSIAPALPSGLNFNTVDGTIDGTPTASSPATVYTVTATNAFGSDTVDLTIGVGLTAPGTIDYGQTTFMFVQGQTVTPVTPTVTGGTPTSWTVAPALPAGLLLNASTGALSGTPTAITAAALYTVTATNPAGSATVDLTIEVATAAPCNLVYSDMLPVYPPGTAITPNVLTVGCGGADTFTISPPLPAGLSFNTATGEITGTPTTRTALATYTVTASNVFGSASVDLDLRVNKIWFIAADDQTVLCGETIFMPLTMLESSLNDTFPTPTVGVSLALAYDATLLEGISLTPGAALLGLNGGGGPDYFGPALNNIDGQMTLGIIYSLLSAESLTADTEQELAILELIGHVPGTANFVWENLVGAPPVNNLVVTDGSATGGNLPVFITPTVTITENDGPAGLGYSEPVAVYGLNQPITPNVPSFTHGTPTGFFIFPALPTGLAMDPVTGVITGTPTQEVTAEVYTISAVNPSGFATTSLTITTGAPPAFTYTNPSPIYPPFSPIPPNAPISTGGTIDSFAISPALPAGFTFDTATGVISGLPIVPYTVATYTITGSNVFGDTDVTMTISPN